jgi:polyisoprenoid-binding protein YceI
MWKRERVMRLQIQFEKTARLARMAAAAWVLLAVVVCARAEDRVRYEARPGSKVEIAGTSTLHDWTMDGQIIGGFLELPAGVKLDPSQADLPGSTGGKVDARVEASIPVRSLKSGHSGMDEVMQEAMDAKDHPKIEYHLTEMALKGPHAAGAPFEFDTKGELVVNGVTNVIAMPVKIENAENGRLRASGGASVKMTDFKVKPPAPTIGLGLITTGDEVRVTFDWLIAEPAKPAP